MIKQLSYLDICKEINTGRVSLENMDFMLVDLVIQRPSFIVVLFIMSKDTFNYNTEMCVLLGSCE